VYVSLCESVRVCECVFVGVSKGVSVSESKSECMKGRKARMALLLTFFVIQKAWVSE